MMATLHMEGTRVDNTEKALDKRRARSLAMPAGCAIVVGIVIMAVPLLIGAAILIMLGGHRGPGPGEGPSPIYLAIPAVGFAFGLGFLVHGSRTRLRQARRRERAALHPGEPWYADWDWDPTGTFEETGGIGALVLVGLLLFGLCVVFTYAFFFMALPMTRPPEEAGINLLIKVFLGLLVGIWDITLLRLIFHGLASLVRRLRSGRAFVHFEAFPFFLGQPLRVRVTASPLAGHEHVTLTLRCLEERRTRVGTARKSDTMVVVQLYEARQTLDGRASGNTGLPVMLQLPSGDYGTRLGPEQWRYWELELETGKDDTISFLVPVY